jgi:acyl carrier protein
MNSPATEISELIQGISKTAKTIAPGKLLVDDLGFDSLKMVDLMLAVEDKFDVPIPIAEAQKIKSVQDLFDAIEHLCSVKEIAGRSA